MDLVLSWLVFPLVLALLCTGAGIMVEALAGTRLPGALLPGCGFAAIIVVGQFLTLADATAELTTPAIVALALAGAVLGWVKRRSLRPPRALVAALVAVFAIYAAPIVLSGEATIAGYIKLDDTATWLTFTDHVMEHGRNLDGLPPSTYEATLDFNIGDGYPVGVFIPLGAASLLLSHDPAWTIQPYMAVLAVLIALGAWSLAGSFVTSSRLRAALVVVASVPALLYGYYLWGGIKELAAAALIATLAPLLGFALARPDAWRRLVAPLVVAAGLIGVLGGGAGPWLGPILLGALVLLVGRVSLGSLLARAAGFVCGVAVLALPVIVSGGLVPPTSSSLSDDDAKGNLLEPLDPLQVAGIWPVGDFRLEPGAGWLTYPLIALALALTVAAAVAAWRRRAYGVLLLITGCVFGALALEVFGSPWVAGKALATASPGFLFAALIGASALWTTRFRAAGAAAAGLIAFGVVWSAALAYRDVSLAPRDQLAELEEIGEAIADSGPTLITEYSPYGARHFLRESAAEGVSELRRRTVPLLNGREVETGFSADTDALDPTTLATYRTLVVRRSPAQSRPPGQYELIWSGGYYQAWRRPPQPILAARLPLGNRYDPVAKPPCAKVLALAESGNDLVAATGTSPQVISLAEARYPSVWAKPGLEFAPVPDGAGPIVARVTVREPGTHEIWLGESVRPRVELWVDDRFVGAVRHVLNNFGQYVALGSVELARGTHVIEVRFNGPDLHPGSGGTASPIGPLVMSRTEAADSRLVRVTAEDARELCGREWDWIETG